MLKAVKVDEDTEELTRNPLPRKGSKELEHVNICIEKTYSTNDVAAMSSTQKSPPDT